MTVRVAQHDASGQQAPDATEEAEQPSHESQQSPARLTPAVVSVNANAPTKLVTQFTVRIPLLWGIVM
jgi:hypothetical protein